MRYLERRGVLPRMAEPAKIRDAALQSLHDCRTGHCRFVHTPSR
ncbi:hypothetical protein [Actinomadura sp. B10D3]